MQFTTILGKLHMKLKYKQLNTIVKGYDSCCTKKYISFLFFTQSREANHQQKLCRASFHGNEISN